MLQKEYFGLKKCFFSKATRFSRDKTPTVFRVVVCFFEPHYDNIMNGVINIMDIMTYVSFIISHNVHNVIQRNIPLLEKRGQGGVGGQGGQGGDLARVLYTGLA